MQQELEGSKVQGWRSVLAALVSLAMTLSLVGVAPAAALGATLRPMATNTFSASASAPVITTQADLNAFATAVGSGTSFAGKTVKIADDAVDGLSLSSCIGSTSNRFEGTFDGNGKSIALNISGESRMAMFCAAGTKSSSSPAVIKNLVTTGSVSVQTERAAGVVSVAAGFLKLENVGNEATIKATGDSGEYAGGLVAYSTAHPDAQDGALTIEGCYNCGSVSASNMYAGGLVGNVGYTDLVISNSYSSAAVSADRYAGGFIGTNAEDSCGKPVSISNSYRAGSVTADYNPGAIIGDKHTSGTFTASNVLNLSSSLDHTGKYQSISGVTNKSESELKAAAATLGSSFKADNASTPINGGYPVLSWEGSSAAQPNLPALSVTLAPGTHQGSGKTSYEISTGESLTLRAQIQELSMGDTTYVSGGWDTYKTGYTEQDFKNFKVKWYKGSVSEANLLKEAVIGYTTRPSWGTDFECQTGALTKAGTYKFFAVADWSAEGYTPTTSEPLQITVKVTAPTFTIAKETAVNGSFSVSADSATEGTTVTVSATPNAGYELDAITVKDASGNDVAVSGGAFTMPAKNVTVSVTFKEKVAKVYTISDEAGFKKFRDDVNAGETDEATTAKVTEDFSVTFASNDLPVGTINENSGGQTSAATLKAKQAFNGTFDGQGHTITLTINKMYALVQSTNGTQYPAGLFGVVGPSGTVKNVTVKGKVATASTSSNPSSSDQVNGAAAGVVGILLGGTVENAANYAQVVGANNVDTCQSAGGIVGYGYGTIKNCANHGDITKINGWAAGIIGRCANAYSAVTTIESCYNTGKITLDGTYLSSYGYSEAGIACSYKADSLGDYSVIKAYNCYNSGDVAFDGLGNPTFYGLIDATKTFSDGIIENSYYLNTLAAPKNGSATAKTAAEMAAPGFVGTLGSAYAASAIEDQDTPMLAWERVAEPEPVTYTISVTAAKGGSVAVAADGESVEAAAEGAQITVTATADEGYELTGVTYTADGEDADDITEAGQFTMPAKNVTVSATFISLDQKAADKVSAQIDALNDDSSAEDVAEVSAAYVALTDAQKALVSVSAKTALETQETRIANEKAAAQDKAAAAEAKNVADQAKSATEQAKSEADEAKSAADEAAAAAQEAAEKAAQSKEAADEAAKTPGQAAIDAANAALADAQDAQKAAEAAASSAADAAAKAQTASEKAQAAKEAADASKAAADKAAASAGKLDQTKQANKELKAAADEAAQAASTAADDATQAAQDAVSSAQDADSAAKTATQNAADAADAAQAAQAAVDKAVAEKAEADKAAAKKVEDAIDALPAPEAITADNAEETKAAAEKASDALDALTEEQKALVSDEAKAKLDAVKAAADKAVGDNGSEGGDEQGGNQGGNNQPGNTGGDENQPGGTGGDSNQPGDSDQPTGGDSNQPGDGGQPTDGDTDQPGDNGTQPANGGSDNTQPGDTGTQPATGNDNSVTQPANGGSDSGTPAAGNTDSGTAQPAAGNSDSALPAADSGKPAAGNTEGSKPAADSGKDVTASGSDTKAEAAAPAKGKALSGGSGATKASYTVSAPYDAKKGYGELVYKRAMVKKSTKKATVPDTVDIDGKTYRVVEIANKAFRDLPKLKTVKVGKYVKKVGKWAFKNSKNVTKLSGFAGVTELGRSAFYGLKKVTKVPSMPKLEKIGAYAFRSCSALKSYTVGKKVSSIGQGAFKSSGVTKLTVKSKKLKTKKAVSKCLSKSKVKTVKLSGLGSAKSKVKKAFKKYSKPSKKVKVF